MEVDADTATPPRGVLPDDIVVNRGVRCHLTGDCAAGAGAFTEAMSRALEVKLEELGKLSLQSAKQIPMNAQCTVFAESEVVTMIHDRVPKADISRAVHDAVRSSCVRKSPRASRSTPSWPAMIVRPNGSGISTASASAAIPPRNAVWPA